MALTMTIHAVGYALFCSLVLALVYHCMCVCVWLVAAASQIPSNAHKSKFMRISCKHSKDKMKDGIVNWVVGTRKIWNGIHIISCPLPITGWRQTTMLMKCKTKGKILLHFCQMKTNNNNNYINFALIAVRFFISVDSNCWIESAFIFIC